MFQRHAVRPAHGLRRSGPAALEAATGFSAFTLLGVAALLALLLASAARFGFALTIPLPEGLLVIALAAAALCPATRRVPRVRALLGLAGLLVILFRAGLAASHTVQAFAHPLRDESLRAVDRALGFDWLGFQRSAHAHPLVFDALGWAYAAFFPQIVAVPALLCVLGRTRRMDTIVGAGVLAQVATFAVGALLPAMGAVSLVGFEDAQLVHHGGATPLGVLLALRDGSLRTIVSDGSGGLVTCPSYHCVIAVISTYGLWCVPRLRYPGLALNLLMTIAALTHGAHYLADVLAGLTLGAVALLVARHAGAESGKPIVPGVGHERQSRRRRAHAAVGAGATHGIAGNGLARPTRE